MKAYCYECNKYVDYTVAKRKERFQVINTWVDVEIYVCRCKECGAEVFVYKYEKLNDKIVFGEYHKITGNTQNEITKRIRN